MEVKLSGISNIYSFKRGCFEKQLDSVEILVLGSSQAFYGIDPDYFTLPAFNLGCISQELFYDRELTLRYLPKMPMLKFVIINISYFSFGYSVTDGTEAWRVYYYSQFWGIDHPGEDRMDLKRYSKFFLYTPNTSLTYLLNGFDVNLNENQSIKGFYRDGTIGVFPAISDSTGYRRVKLHENYYSEDRVQENQENLELLVKGLRNRGVEVLIITPPVQPTYYKFADRSKIERNSKIIKMICTKYNCIYHDYFTDQRFKPEDFTDNDHLNFHGAVKFTGILNEMITSLQN